MLHLKPVPKAVISCTSKASQQHISLMMRDYDYVIKQLGENDNILEVKNVPQKHISKK
jgi:hypothetical protein